MKTYAEYKDSGVKWIGEIPSHWEMKRLRNYLRLISIKGHGDKTLLSVTREQGVIVRNVESKEENHNYIPDDLNGYKLVRKGQFVINKMKSWQGSYGVSSKEGIVSPAYYVCDLNYPCREFFSWAIRSKAYVPFFTQYSKGIRVDQWDLSPIALKSIPFISPTEKEQQAIVDYLKVKTDKIEQYVAQRERERELLDSLKQSEIANVVTKGLNPNAPMKDSGIPWIGLIPEHWEVKTLKRCVNLGKGKSVDTNLPYIDLEHIESYTGKILPLDNTKPDSVCSTFDKGDILFCKLRPYLTKCVIAPFKGICSSELLVLKNFIGNTSYLNFILLSKDFVMLVNSSTYGSKMPRASWNFIGTCSIPFPPKDEQDAIVEHLSQKLQKIDAYMADLQAEIDYMKEFKQRLISDVVTGKINVSQTK